VTAHTWPAELPEAPEHSQWSFRRRPNTDAFDPEIGPPITTRRTTAAGAEVEVVFMMTTAQYVIFDAFYEATLKSGTRKFEWVHPLTGEMEEWMFVPGTTPEQTLLGGEMCLVSFQLFMFT